MDDGASPLELDAPMIQWKHQDVIFGTIFVFLGTVSREVPSTAKPDPTYKLGSVH
jgi:hypothetical protein